MQVIIITLYLSCFSAALTVGKGGIDSLTLHVGMLGVAGLVTVTFPFYTGAVCMRAYELGQSHRRGQS